MLDRFQKNKNLEEGGGRSTNEEKKGKGRALEGSVPIPKKGGGEAPPSGTRGCIGRGGSQSPVPRAPGALGRRGLNHKLKKRGGKKQT